MKIVKNDLFDYIGRFIYQDIDSFKFSIDSILLSEFVNIRKKDEIICDLCTGNGPIPMILSTKTNKKIVGFEIQKNIYELAKKSVSENKLDEQITLINDDVKNIGKYFDVEDFDILTCNPPYFRCYKESPVNDKEALSIARHELKLQLEDVFLIASKYLCQDGRLYLVHRPERLDDIIILGNKYHVNVKVIQLVCTNKSNKPNLVLVKCVKNSKNDVIINPVINTSGLDSYQNIFGR
jgi:tRNA1(Val) A37 N6-methylase TrmN6